MLGGELPATAGILMVLTPNWACPEEEVAEAGVQRFESSRNDSEAQLLATTTLGGPSASRVSEGILK